MNDNVHFSSGQSGFLGFHSTVTCLLKNTDDWYNGMDLGKLVGLVFIDLKKRHSILLIITFSVKSSIITAYSNVNYLGLNPTFPTGNSFARIMVWIQKLGT